MTNSEPLRRLIPAGLTVAALLAVAAPASAAGTTILSGPLAAGGTRTLGASHKTIGTVKGLCLELTPTLADGSSPGSGSGCAAGSLSVSHGVFPTSARFATGDTVTAYVVAGIVPSRARTVRVTYADGKCQRIATKAGPKAWSRVLGATVRSYGADALPVSTATVKRIAGYDARGRRVARSTVAGG
jgi:hypothetical protein